MSKFSALLEKKIYVPRALIDTFRMVGAGLIGGAIVQQCNHSPAAHVQTAPSTTPVAITPAPSAPERPSSLSPDGSQYNIRLTSFSAITADNLTVRTNSMSVDIATSVAGDLKEDALHEIFSNCATSTIGKNALKNIGAANVLDQVSKELIGNPNKDTADITFTINQKTNAAMVYCISSKLPPVEKPGTITADDANPVFVWTSKMYATIAVKKL